MIRPITTPAMITTAITGAIPRKADNPAVPVTPSEQIGMELMPQATWSALGTDRNTFKVNEWCLELGGHTRKGISKGTRKEPEDTIMVGKDKLASSNAELVQLVVEAAGE